MSPAGSSSRDAVPTTPTPAAGDASQDVAALVSLARQRELTETDLDELVYEALNAGASRAVNGAARPELSFLDAFDAEHDRADEAAARINNQGLEARIEALASEFGIAAAGDLLRDNSLKHAAAQPDIDGMPGRPWRLGRDPALTAPHPLAATSTGCRTNPSGVRRLRRRTPGFGLSVRHSSVSAIKRV
ncbi:hypothetical protein ACIQC7_35515 [Kitasatospora sp. NPDC088556]|uniref:hypothetical protein n=1 Tax=Kitasatospora sp. NPDC088556 TaxID=3364076 RepID=UPI003813C48E